MTVNLAHTATGGISMPAKLLINHVELQKFKTEKEEETCVDECRILHDCLYNRNDNVDAAYGDMTERLLDTMESFVSVTPMPVMRGEMVFLCNCGYAVIITMRVNIQGCSPCSGIRT
jgi:hypothetical protein